MSVGSSFAARDITAAYDLQAANAYALYGAVSGLHVRVGCVLPVVCIWAALHRRAHTQLRQGPCSPQSLAQVLHAGLNSQAQP